MAMESDPVRPAPDAPASRLRNKAPPLRGRDEYTRETGGEAASDMVPPLCMAAPACKPNYFASISAWMLSRVSSLSSGLPRVRPLE